MNYKRRKIISVVGARPQFIKASMVSPLIRTKYREIIVHTGQHYDAEMSENFFKELKIPKVDYNLQVGSDSPLAQIANILKRIQRVFLKEKPDLVMVYGDTNSTLAGALAAAGLGFKIAHVEAGLRSYRKDMPEEINRIITDNLSSFLFCPTENAVTNLGKEGIVKGVYNVGDVMYDACLSFLKEAKKKSRILSMFKLYRKPYYLATIHRAINTDSKERLEKIIGILSRLNQTVLFPVHPRTKKALKRFNIKIKNLNIRLINPVGYFDMLMLESNAKVILTDSGGIQKEASFFKIPCITLRSETEWTETVSLRMNVLADIDVNKVLKGIESFSSCPSIDKAIALPYGDGHAGEKILKIINKVLK